MNDRKTDINSLYNHAEPNLRSSDLKQVITRYIEGKGYDFIKNKIEYMNEVSRQRRLIAPSLYLETLLKHQS